MSTPAQGMGEIMGLFNRKAWEPEPMDYRDVYDYLEFVNGAQFNSDPWVARLFMPKANFGESRYWYRGTIHNLGTKVEVKVEGKRIGYLDERALADAVDLLRVHGGDVAPVAVRGYREGNQTQGVIGNLEPPKG